MDIYIRFEKCKTFHDDRRSNSTYKVNVYGPFFSPDFVKFLGKKFNDVRLTFDPVHSDHISFVVRGSSKRNVSSDEYDKYTGLDLSEYRAIRKGYSTGQKIVNTYKEYTRKIDNQVHRANLKFDDKLASIDSKLANILK